MNIQIRELTLNDNLEEVAKLIYQTDPYIYPYWFENYNNWEQVLVRLLTTKGSIFYYKNIVIAIKDSHIIGIIVWLNNKTDLCYNYSDLIVVNKNFEYTINKYIKQIPPMIGNDLYIPNVCVDINYRRKGVGYQMMSYIKSKHKKDISLHCLADNISALNLYSKCGFKIQTQEKGFNAPHKQKPLIVKMKYYNNT